MVFRSCVRNVADNAVEMPSLPKSVLQEVGRVEISVGKTMLALRDVVDGRL